MKKIIASLAAIATVLSLSVVSFAVDPGDSNAEAENTQTVEADKNATFTFDTGAQVVAAAGAFEAGEVTIVLQATDVEKEQASVATALDAILKKDDSAVINTVVSIDAYLNYGKDDEKEVEPKGDITITVKADQGSNAVAYVDENGKVETIELNVVDGLATFKVTHFSDFYMVKVADVNKFLGKASTGDDNKPTGVAIAIVPAAIAAAAVVVSKKRK